MKKNKVVLPLIIILLLCFLPCSVYGIYQNIMDSKEQGNPNHLHKLDNKLYYYDEKDNLIGTYSCRNSICDTAVSSPSDSDFPTYEGENVEVNVFNDYIFIQDGDYVVLHNLKNNMTIATFKSIKNYGTTFDNNSIIVENLEGLYGLFNMNSISFVVPQEYEKMDIMDTFDGKYLVASTLVVKNGNGYFLINDKGEELTKANENPIYFYDQKYVYHKSNQNYLIFDYKGNGILSNINIISHDKLNGYNIIRSDAGIVNVYNNDYDLVTEYGEYGQVLDYVINGNIVEIYNGNTKIDEFDTNN